MAENQSGQDSPHQNPIAEEADTWVKGEAADVDLEEMDWLSWALGNVTGVAGVFLAQHLQKRYQTSLREELARIAFGKTMYRGQTHLVVEVINIGHFPLFIREVGIDIPGEELRPLETRSDLDEEPIQPGGMGIYTRGLDNPPPIDRDMLPGSWIIVESPRGMIAREQIPTGGLDDLDFDDLDGSR